MAYAIFPVSQVCSVSDRWQMNVRHVLFYMMTSEKQAVFVLVIRPDGFLSLGACVKRKTLAATNKLLDKKSALNKMRLRRYAVTNSCGWTREQWAARIYRAGIFLQVGRKLGIERAE